MPSERLAEQFEEHRPHVRAVGYRPRRRAAACASAGAAQGVGLRRLRHQQLTCTDLAALRERAKAVGEEIEASSPPTLSARCSRRSMASAPSR